MERHYRFTSWLDEHWGMLHAQLTQKGLGPKRHPVLFYIGTVPLTTWLSHPGWGVDSVRRHVTAQRERKTAGKGD